MTEIIDIVTRPGVQLLLLDSVPLAAGVTSPVHIVRLGMRHRPSLTIFARRISGTGACTLHVRARVLGLEYLIESKAFSSGQVFINIPLFMAVRDVHVTVQNTDGILSATVNCVAQL